MSLLAQIKEKQILANKMRVNLSQKREKNTFVKDYMHMQEKMRLFLNSF